MITQNSPRRTARPLQHFSMLLTAVFFSAAILTASTAMRSASAAEEVAEVKIGILTLKRNKRFSLSRLNYPANDDGIAGAEVAIIDNNTTGRFTKQKFSLTSARVSNKDDPVEAVKKIVDEGIAFVILDLPAESILKVSDAFKGQDVLFFNASAKDNALRQEQCRANVMHIALSRAMLADAIVQYLVVKKWTKLFLVQGVLPPDVEYADSIRHAARKFGAKIVDERKYAEKRGSSRTDGGHELIRKQMLVFTQGAKEHDVIVVADESELFGHYVPYRAWSPRPVVGTSGLTPKTFHVAHEQWGASQFQNRFLNKAKRLIKPVDYSAFIAVRLIGEAATRSDSVQFKPMSDYLKGPDVAIPGFKGQKMTFRDWNYQLRQPIMLTDRNLAVSWSPQEGFLHQKSRLDTLGFDKPESKCKLN